MVAIANALEGAAHSKDIAEAVISANLSENKGRQLDW